MSGILDMSFADVLSAARQDHNAQAFPIVLLRQMTVDHLAPFLRVGGRDLGLDIDVRLGQFDAIFQDLNDDKLWAVEPSATIVCLSPERFAPEIMDSAGEDNPAAAQELSDAIVARAAQLIHAIRQRTTKPILWIGLFDGLMPPAGIADWRRGTQSREAQIDHINRQIEAQIQATGPGWVINVQACAARVGSRVFFDPVRWHSGGMPFSVAGFRELSIELLAYLRSQCGGAKKVLALDCDDTLWAGLVGEEGPESVDVGPYGMPGGAHRALQAAAKGLRQRGVLLVLVSKNEAKNVWSVFDTRKDMILQREDIAAARINWLPKPDNLRSLAEELNLGLDSFVFIDDQSSEIAAVEQFCPEVDCLQVSPETIARLPQIIDAKGWFASTQITSTDRIRTETYRANTARNQLQIKTTDISEFLRELKMIATLRVDIDVDVKRAAQMCQRTNQFNMTTRRHTEPDIENFVRSENSHVISLDLEDRFGRLGDVGLVIVDMNNSDLVVDTMLLSCRAFGRCCEDLMLAAIAAVADSRKADRIVGQYIPNGRNDIVSQFWEGRGFDVQQLNEGAQHAILDARSIRFMQPDVFEAVQTGDLAMKTGMVK